MAAKRRPKFPRKDRLKKRLGLALALVLVLAGTGLGLHYYLSQSETRDGFDTLAASLAEKKADSWVNPSAANHFGTKAADQKIAGSKTPGGKAPGPSSATSTANSSAGAAPSQASPTAAPGPSPSAPSHPAPLSPPAESPIPMPPAVPSPAATAPEAPGKALGDKERPVTPTPTTPAPFPGKSLQDIAIALSGLSAGTPPTQWGERLPGITSRLWPEGRGAGAAGQAAAHPVVALTFDACGGGAGSGYDPRIIALMRKEGISATLFVTSVWMRANPQTLRELAADPLFEIAAHGTRHKPCSLNGKSVYGIKGTASLAELLRETEGNARDIEAATGMRPRWFRSGTAFYDEVAVAVIRKLGLNIAGYSIAADQGATLPAGAVAAKTLAAKDGDILLFHMNHPKSGTYAGLEKALPVLKEKGFSFVRLSSAPAR